MNGQHEALDAKEGLLTVVETRQADGTIKLSLTNTLSGAKYPANAPRRRGDRRRGLRAAPDGRAAVSGRSAPRSGGG